MGLSLKGYDWKSLAERPDVPFIALLRTGSGGGHFVVVNPVGRGRSLVQVVNPPNAPELIDFLDFAGDYSWTGFALVPASSHPRMLWIGFAAGSIVIAFIAWHWFLGRSPNIGGGANQRAGDDARP